MNGNLCLLVNLASTWAMLGLIWLIQIVHYPLFELVGSTTFREYADRHQRLITFVVLPLMFAELLTTVLLYYNRPATIPNWTVITGIVLVLIIWASTFFLQVPQHGQLSLGFDAAVHRQLVNGNWIRTFAWSLRGLLTFWMAWLALTAR